MSENPKLAEQALALRLEQARRWRNHDRAPAEAYLAEQPELNANPEYALEVIYGELLLREEEGETPLPEEFFQRFPQFAYQLQQLFEVHGALGSGHLLASQSTPSQSRPTWPALAGDAPPEDLPLAVGHYVLGPELKRGGMGRIVQVWDQDFKRPLALKMVRRRHAQLEQRLVYEGQLTGFLQHPGIPPVHDQGHLPDGRPYFIMKLIQGSSLSELLSKRPSPAAELPRFLLIFEQLCEAVGYAHSRQVIHRDLKPGNVMVGAFGEVQVIDWGLAKMMRQAPVAEPTPASAADTWNGLKRTGLFGPETTAESALGTPAYMAPEQARGELSQLDARADVFGLGGILCEVLTGNPPYSGRDVVGIHTKAKQADLTDAWARLKNCGADNELVALTRACLAADKEARPATGAAVAEAVAAYRREVQRRLKAAEIEAATAATKAEEEKKLRVAESARAEEEVRRRKVEGQRRRVAVALMAVVVVLVSCGSAAALWYRDYLARQEQQENARNIRSDYQNGKAQSDLAEGEKGIQQLDQPLVSSQPVSVLRNDLKKWREQLKTVEAIELRVRTLIDGDKDLVKFESVERLGQLQKQLKREQDGLTLAEELEDVRLKASTQVDSRVNRSLAIWEDPKVFARQGNYPKLQYLEGLAARELPKVFAKAHLNVEQGEPRAVAARIAASPARYALVAALDYWASVLADLESLGKLPEEEKGLALLSAGTVGLLGSPTGNGSFFAGSALIARTGGLQARLLEIARLADPDPWRDRFRNVKVWEDPAKVKELEKEVNVKQQSPAVLLILASRLKDSRIHRENFLVKAVRHYKQDFWLYLVLGNDATNPRERAAWYQAALSLRPESAPVHFNLGNAYYAQKKIPEALAQFNEAIELDPKLAVAYIHRGLVLRDLGDPGGAMDQFRKAIRIDSHAAVAYLNLGVVLSEQRDFPGAIAAYRKAIACQPQLTQAYNNLGNVLDKQRDFPGAIAEYRKAIATDPNFAPAYANLGTVLHAQKDLPGAIALYREAIKLNDKYAHAHYLLGLARGDQQNLPGAIAAYRKAIACDPNLVEAYNNLGIASFVQNDLAGASDQFRKVIELQPRNAQNYMNLALALFGRKDFAGAIAQFSKAIELAPNHPLAHLRQGEVLLHEGQLTEALQATRRALQLAPASHPLQKRAQQQLQHCEKLLALERSLNDFLTKGELSGQHQDWLALIDLCQNYKQYHATAARLYGRTLTAVPALAEDRERRHRYQAARSALLAAAGKGRDPSPLTLQDKARLRDQALAWLQADLQVWAKQFRDRDLKALPGLLLDLPAWQKDSGLEGVRLAKELAKLPQDEQIAWQQLWAEVDLLRAQVVANVRTVPFRGTLTAPVKERGHEVKLQAGKVYLIDLESTAFDAYLRLHDSSGKLLAENDDIVAGVNLNARLIFTAPADGNYRLVATSFEQRGTGDYTLTVRSFRAGKE